MKVESAKDRVGISKLEESSSESMMMGVEELLPGSIEVEKSLKIERESEMVGERVEEDFRSIGWREMRRLRLASNRSLSLSC